MSRFKNPDGSNECKICGMNLNPKHLKAKHNFNSKMYYDLFFKKKDEGICPICNKETKFKSIPTGYMEFCSQKCMSQGTRDRVKKSNLEKYGVQTWVNPEKAKQTFANRTPEQIKEHVEKIKKTKQKRYNNENYNNMEKNKQTCLKRYGVDNYSKSKHRKLNNKNINIKTIQTKLKKYGVKHHMKNVKIKEKRKHTIENKFYKNFIKEILPKFEELKFKVLKVPLNWRDKIEFVCDKGHETSIYLSNFNVGCRCPKCTLGGTSKAELEIADFLKSKGLKVIQNSRKLIPPRELDIYLPEKNIAIEFNGLYWHSEGSGTPKKYHLEKTLECEKNNIQLLHIFENEWLYKQDIIKSIILAKCGKFDRILYARKCKIKEIDTKTKTKFLNNNHIQGTVGSSINLGLFYEDELVACMTFGQRKITAISSFELLRFCNKLNTSVVGGAQKLFKYFINNNSTSIITYADKRFSNGEFYKKLGFSLKHISDPNYWYFNEERFLESRVKYQKHKLHNILKNFDPKRTEFENMLINGYDRIWDCGNYVFEYII